jgi:hypothetical protein
MSSGTMPIGNRVLVGTRPADTEFCGTFCDRSNAAKAASFNHDCASVFGFESMLLGVPLQNAFSTA